jgi:hypothetical protein
MCEYAIFFGIEEIPGLLELVEGNERSASGSKAIGYP